MIEPALALQHLKSDNEDIEEDLLANYIASAVSICEGYCVRKFYESQTKKDADFDTAMLDLVAAREERDTAIQASTEDCVTKLLIERYISQRSAIQQRANGIVVNQAIKAAILLTLGHLYRNRQDVITGQNAGATKLPVGAERILQPYVWPGDLA